MFHKKIFKFLPECCENAHFLYMQMRMESDVIWILNSNPDKVKPLMASSLTFGIPAWISNYMSSKVWDESTYLPPNSTVQARIMMSVTICPCWDKS